SLASILLNHSIASGDRQHGRKLLIENSSTSSCGAETYSIKCLKRIQEENAPTLLGLCLSVAAIGMRQHRFPGMATAYREGRSRGGEFHYYPTRKRLGCEYRVGVRLVDGHVRRGWAVRNLSLSQGRCLR